MLFLSQFFASKRSDPGSELGSLILKLLKASFDAESNKSIQHELEIKLSKELEVLLKQYFAASFPTMENPEVLELLVYALGDLSDFPMCSKKLIKLLNYFIEQDEKISEIIQSIIADKIYKEYCRHWFAIPAPKDKIISLTKAATRMLQLLNIVVGELEIKPDCYDTINVLRCLCVNLTELVHMYLYNSQVKTMLSFFNVQYELATRIVASMDPSDEKCVQLKYNEYADHIVKYLRKFHFPVGTTIAAGSVAARLYLLNARREALDGAADPASQDSTLRLNYDNLLNRFGKDVNSKASVVILFSLLQHCDSIELLRLKNREGENILRSHMLNVIAKWDNKADPNYVFYTSHIYYSFTKYFAFNVSYNTIADDLRKDILAIIEDIFVYAQQYWAHSNRIKHYYRMIENCFILLKRLLDFEFDLDSEFRAYICSFFVDKVNESSDVNYVFRMISLYYETVGVENFSHLFRSTLGAWFNEEFTFYKIFDRFMTQQNISTFDADNNKDDGGGGDERLNLPQHLHGYRISDMAELVSIRLILFKDEDIGIVVHEFKHLLSKPTYGDFFFEFIMPKLKNPKALMVLRELFLTLLYFHSNSIPPNSTLAILKCCHQRRCAIEKEMKRLIIARLVATIFQDYYNDQLGLQTLSFLVENDYQTLVANLDQIDQLFTKCAAIQSASGRSELVSSLGKLYHKLSHKIDPNCEAFLSQLLSKCFDNLKLNSYFGSVLVHLGLIHLVLENWINWRPGLLSFPFNSKQVGALFLMLNHNFEEIRKTAVASILLLHHHRLYHFMRREIGQLEDKYDTLQPNDLAIGVNKFRLWFTLTEQLGEQILEDLLQKVNERLATTKLNQMNFVKHPCSPILAAIRSLVCDCIDVNELAKSNPSKWADLLKRLVATCLECSTAVRPIVGNESPEGNLPEEELVTDLKQMHIQSQKLLNSGWMTTRQSALILMHLVASFPVHDNTLLDCDDIGRIIGHFYENQMLLVHRGAFETSSSSFKAIAQSLFRVPTKCSICIGKFGAILAKIDDDLLCDTTGTGHKSITRRSAGLPFVVASIIGAECCNISPPINAPKFVGRLVSFLEQNVSGGNDDGGRIPKKQPHQIVHIFNILKALVCDALLHRFMADWLERIMIATLDWFDKSRYGQYLALGSTHLEQGQQAYSIHNSASMVFSALITRVFGVKRNRTDTSKKNRMSMFLFFSAYSRLYEYIIEVFQSCLDRKEMNMRLNPVLIILSRLTLSKDPNSLSKTTVLCLKIDELLQTCHDARLVRLLIDVYCQISRKSSLANEVEMLVRQIDEHCSGMCLVSHYRLRAWAMLLAQLLAQYSETEQVSDARLNASLEKAYLTLSIYLRLPFTGKAFVSSEFHIIRARIYQLLAHPQCKPTSSFKPIVLDRPESSNDNLVIRDVLNVNWTFDTTVHMLLDDKENFARSLVGLLQEDLPSESRLLLWRCLDQSFTRENKGKFVFEFLKICN